VRHVGRRIARPWPRLHPAVGLNLDVILRKHARRAHDPSAIITPLGRPPVWRFFLARLGEVMSGAFPWVRKHTCGAASKSETSIVQLSMCRMYVTASCTVPPGNRHYENAHEPQMR
jgi:hypothetical protein